LVIPVELRLLALGSGVAVVLLVAAVVLHQLRGFLAEARGDSLDLHRACPEGHGWPPSCLRLRCVLYPGVLPAPCACDSWDGPCPSDLFQNRQMQKRRQL